MIKFLKKILKKDVVDNIPNDIKGQLLMDTSISLSVRDIYEDVNDTSKKLLKWYNDAGIDKKHVFMAAVKEINHYFDELLKSIDNDELYIIFAITEYRDYTITLCNKSDGKYYAIVEYEKNYRSPYMLLSSTYNDCTKVSVKKMSDLFTDTKAHQFIIDFINYKESFEKIMLDKVKLSASRKKRDLSEEKEFIMALDKFNKKSVN